ncbi:hypothetical protein [Henriciella marina]|uniref:Imelysin-like domain-containing protein n=1 Tax=Henriciella marina TaxID=453851 RepID=A0ABT4LQQ3_9PROT|nr:hypothetical protein [Henriciella marina]MCZ4296668.1 hypothetical protein [Henriciella marina]
MRATLTALFMILALAGTAAAQDSTCGADVVATGETLLERAQGLEESEETWEGLFEQIVIFQKQCSQSFEIDFAAADAAWELADHGGQEGRYRAASFVLSAIRSIENRWLGENAARKGVEPDQDEIDRRDVETEQLAILIENFVAPTILHAIGHGRYYESFNGPDETCPYIFGHLAQIEARAQFDGIVNVLEGNPADSVTLPIIPGDYRLLVLRDKCFAVADDVRLVRAYLLAQLAGRAFDNPGVPMPDGSTPPETLATTLIEQAQAEIAAMDNALMEDNAFIKEEADALAARISGEEGG